MLLRAYTGENSRNRGVELGFSCPAFFEKIPAMFDWRPISVERKLNRRFFDTGYKMAISVEYLMLKVDHFL